jgi:hypothetical protein
MPIPKPNTGENETDFISRCMSDEKMKSEYNEEQRLAVCYTQLAKPKISFDYDGTLTTAKGLDKAKALNADLYIISARSIKVTLKDIADKLNIPYSRVFATGSNKSKIEKIKELGISKHYDNNPDVIKELGSIGELIN